MKKGQLLTLGVILLLATACGNKGSNNGDNGGNDDKKDDDKTDSITNKWWQTTGSLEKDSDGNVVFDNVDINLTTVVAGEDLGSFSTLVDQFNAEYRNKISVSLTSVGQGEFEDTVGKQISNNTNAPDLIMSHQKGHKAFADSKLIQPFDEAMKESGITISLNDYASGLSQYSDLGYEGYTFGIPIDAQSEVVYYNKTLLAKYGGELPTNREDLLTICAQAKADGITPIACSTRSTFFTQYVFPTAIVQNGGSFFDNTYHANWGTGDNLESYKNAMKSLRELNTLGYMNFGADESACTTKFINDQALFFISCPWYIASISSGYSSTHGKTAVADVIANKIGGASYAGWFSLNNSDSSNKIFGDSHFFAMSSTVKNIEKKAAILEFCKWFSQTVSVQETWAEAGHITASTIVSNDDEYLDNTYVETFISQFYPDINEFTVVGNTPYYTTTFDKLTELWSTLSSGQEANDEASIKTAANDVNSLIDFLG